MYPHLSLIHIYTSDQILQALDVHLEENIFSFDPGSKAAALEKVFPMLEDIRAVSYTHLDVYKRQAMFREYPCKRRFALLGDMLELGDISRAAHEEVGRQAVENLSLIHILLRPSSRITAQPSSSSSTCSGLEPWTMGQ